MNHYLLSIQQPDGGAAPPEILEPIIRRITEFNDEMRAAGVWVFAGGLFPAEMAHVARPDGGEVLTTDGPYVEAKEHVGGLSIIAAPDDASALEWGRKLAQATTLPVEVRLFQGQPSDHVA